MNLRNLTLALLLFLNSIGLLSQISLYKPIYNTSDSLTYKEITDTITKYHGLNFSNDASLIPDTLKGYRINPQLTIEDWLNQEFRSDSSEWVLLESQIIIRRKREITKGGEKPIRLVGKVHDLKKSAIPFASVTICNSSKGTIANDEGEFQFILPKETTELEIIISSLGFISDTVLIKDFYQLHTITLREAVTNLAEVAFISLNPNTIINQVINSISENYPNNYTMLSGFFRETIKKNDKYLEVTEAAVLINKPPYSSDLTSEKVMVEKIRNYKDTVNMGHVALRLAGGPFYFAKLDVVRYTTFLNMPNDVPTYKYFYEGLDTDQGHVVYVIKFKPIADNDDLLYEGTIFVDSESSAITSVHFHLTKGSIKKSKSYLVKRESGKSKSIPIAAQYQISYRPDGNKWILSYVRGELNLRITNREHKENSDFWATTELAITESSEGKYQILKDGIAHSNEIVADRAKENSQLFWNNFNSIPPLPEVRILFEK